MQIKINYLNKEGQPNDAIIDIENKERVEEIKKEILRLLMNKEDIILKGRNDILFLNMDSVEACKVSIVDEESATDKEPTEMKFEDGEINYARYGARLKPFNGGEKIVPNDKIKECKRGKTYEGYATGINNNVHPIMGDSGKEIYGPIGSKTKPLSEATGVKELLQPVNVTVNIETNMDKIFEEIYKRIGDLNKEMGYTE